MHDNYICFRAFRINFIINTDAVHNLIKARSPHPETKILKEDTLHVSGITKGIIETLGFIQVSLMGHPNGSYGSVKFYVVFNNFLIPRRDLRKRFPKEIFSDYQL
jgi:hypothetical protein